MFESVRPEKKCDIGDRLYTKILCFECTDINIFAVFERLVEHGIYFY